MMAPNPRRRRFRDAAHRRVFEREQINPGLARESDVFTVRRPVEFSMARCRAAGWQFALHRAAGGQFERPGCRSYLLFRLAPLLASAIRDPRGNELLHSLEKVLSQQQIAEARERASKLRQQEPLFAARTFAQ
jgi:hypothetical protein